MSIGNEDSADVILSECSESKDLRITALRMKRQVGNHQKKLVTRWNLGYNKE